MNKHNIKYRSKLWRNKKKYFKYIKRLKRSAPHWGCLYVWTPQEIIKPKWTDLYNYKGTFQYKTTSTPCSCSACVGERYNRLDYKKETNKETEIVKYPEEFGEYYSESEKEAYKLMFSVDYCDLIKKYNYLKKESIFNISEYLHTLFEKYNIKIINENI